MYVIITFYLLKGKLSKFSQGQFPLSKGKIMKCYFCGEAISIDGKVSRRDTCPHCNRDLRCCKQCKFYEQGAYNECKEVAAERIIDKERANLCDYFTLKGSKGVGGGGFNRTRDAKEALEALFKKK